MNNHYRKLSEQFTDKVFNNAADQTELAYLQQNKDQKQFLDMVANVLLSFTIIDSVLKISSKDRKSIESKFDVFISNISNNQFNDEKKLMEEILRAASIDKYYTEAYITQLGMDFNLQKITAKEIAKIVYSKVDGKLWSDRLWDNKKDLQKKLQNSIGEFLQGRVNVNQIEKEIKKRFNQNAYNTHRLVQSEVARCQSEANDVFADNHNIKKQLYSATLDSKTSEMCRGFDGIVYDVDDPNKRIPGVNTHPLCRSCLINLPSEDWRPELRRDQENNKTINWTAYQEWYDKNIEKPVSSDIIRLSDTSIGRSVGAKAKNYDIQLPSGDYVNLAEGTKITNSTVIAGKGRNRQIDMLDTLVADYGGNPEDWQKAKGFGYVNIDGEVLKAELHWYQEPTVGKVNMKIKQQKDGELFIYES